jgi:hypothetical protein
MRRTAVALLVAVSTLCWLVQPALAERGDYPHDFTQNNMGYCAPYLAQQELPNGDNARPFINHVIQDATHGDASFEGSKNLGDFYNDKARSEDDQRCLAR